MKRIILMAALCGLFACSKQPFADTAIPVTVKGSVINEAIPSSGSNQQYWKAGIIFDRIVTASGSATVTWYYAGQSYSQVVPFAIPGNSSGHYVFTTYKVDFTMIADSVKISSFELLTGNYNVTVK